MTKTLTADEYLALIRAKIEDGLNCVTGVSPTAHFAAAQNHIINYVNSAPAAQARTTALRDSLAHALRLYRDMDEVAEYLESSTDEKLKRHLQNHLKDLSTAAQGFALEAQEASATLAAADTSYS